jgi:hypothetical protein
MAAIKVNQKTKKLLSLKKLAKQKKKLGGGDSGILTLKGSNTFR